MEFDLSISNILEAGGFVTWAILCLCLVLWVLLFERFIFIRSSFPAHAKSLHTQWLQRNDRSSWCAKQIRQGLLSNAQTSLMINVPTINVLIALCPLLGLLGTVTGMVSVFDVMAFSGTGNARAMASGISQATIPTMAGMMVAITGLYFCSLLQSSIKKNQQQFADSLELVN